jgi:hypothetical protein
MGAKSDPAAGQIVCIALGHCRLPAVAGQEMRREQPAQRSADDERAPAHDCKREANMPSERCV